MGKSSDGLTEPVDEAPPEIRGGAASYQRWFETQSAAGNTLEGARLLWSWPPAEVRDAAGGGAGTGAGTGAPFLWAMHVAVRVAAEDRVKSNEVILSRPDICAVALYRPAATLDESVVVLIREFRSPASTADGFVHELPSGSGSERGVRAQAVAELAEETGLRLDPQRLRAHGSRQSAATLSTHHVHLFSAVITEDELAWLRARHDKPQGDGGGSERTWVEIATFGEIRRQRLVDWTTLGMVAQCLLEDADADQEL